MKVCPNCKNNIDDASVFCAVCGANVTAPQPEPQPAVEYAQPTPPQGAPEPSAAYAQQTPPQGQQVPPQGQQTPPQGQPVPPQGVPYYNGAQPQADQFDHTSEFDEKDIADNKLVAMLIYLLGIIGIVVAFLVKKESPYLNFHIRQGIKFVIIETLASLATALLCWTCIAPVVGGVFLTALAVVQIIAFFDVCNGKAKEAPIVRSFKFLD